MVGKVEIAFIKKGKCTCHKRLKYAKLVLVFLFNIMRNKVVTLSGSRRYALTMEAVMVTLIILSSIALVALIVMQSGKSEGLAGAISGGAEQLFGKKKARGLDAVLQKATIVASVVFFVATFAFAYII